MFEINVTINCPDLMKAATLLASALGGIEISESALTSPAIAPATPNASGTMQPAQYGAVTPAASQPSVPPVSQTAPVNPVAANPTIGHPSMTMTGSCPSSAVPTGGVPLAPAPTFTLEQVSKAGADLLTAQPAKMQELMALLAQFGVQAVNALRPDQLGAFATALRGMGAQI